MAAQPTLCEVCQTNPGKTIMTAPCGHHFCPLCIAKAYRASFDYPRKPAQCCRKFLPYNNQVCELLMDMCYGHYDEKTSRSTDPEMIHCRNRRCNRYKRPHVALSSAERCMYCLRPACGNCKHLAHDETCGGCAGCKKRSHWGICNDGSVQLLRLALKKMWMQCPSCRMMGEQVEKSTNVVNCVCGAYFCYYCGGFTTRGKDCLCRLNGRAFVLRTWRKVKTEVRILVSPSGLN